MVGVLIICQDQCIHIRCCYQLIKMQMKLNSLKYLLIPHTRKYHVKLRVITSTEAIIYIPSSFPKCIMIPSEHIRLVTLATNTEQSRVHQNVSRLCDNESQVNKEERTGISIGAGQDNPRGQHNTHADEQCALEAMQLKSFILKQLHKFPVYPS